MTLSSRIDNTNLPIGHELVEGAPHHAVVVYGNATCPDSARARAVLENLGIEYNFYNIELDPAMARTAASLRGEGRGEAIPVVDFGGGSVLIEPTDAEIEDALKQTGRLRTEI
jgi:glutaredoxin